MTGKSAEQIACPVHPDNRRRHPAAMPNST
jgi:hypothetical protein